MGSRSRANTVSSQTSVQDVDTTNIAVSDTEGLSIGAAGGSINVTMSDAGAMEAAENIGVGAIALAGDVTTQALLANQFAIDRSFEFGEGLVSETIETLGGAIQEAGKATRSDTANVMNNIVKYCAMAAAALGLFFVIGRARA